MQVTQKEKDDLKLSLKGNISLGFFQTLARLWMGKNADVLKSIYLAVSMSIISSLADTISDTVVAITLILEGEWVFGLTILAIDYIPMWQVLLHSISSQAWKELNNPKEKWITVIILLFAPISTPLFQIRWLMNYSTKPKNIFTFQHRI